MAKVLNSLPFDFLALPVALGFFLMLFMLLVVFSSSLCIVCSTDVAELHWLRDVDLGTNHSMSL